MVGESSPELRQPPQKAAELAASLQFVLDDVPNRDFRIDDPLQEAAFSAIGHGILDGQTAGYLDAYTGFGKSLYVALLAEAGARAGQRVLVLTHSTPDADQLIGFDGTTGIGRFTHLNQFGLVTKHYGGQHGNAESPVVVSTYSSFIRESKADRTGNGQLGDFDLILANECHRSLGTETSRELIRYMPDANRIGFSATPDYAEDRKSEEVFKRPWFEYSLRSAIDDGRAAPIRALLMATDVPLELSDTRAFFTEKELEPLVGNIDRNGYALKLAQDFVADGRQGFMACIAGKDNAHATIMAALLNKMEANGRPIVAEAIGSHQSKDEQKRILQEYRDGKIDVITFTQLLEEGWDSDVVSFGINLQPSTSPRRIRQLLGRLARPKADGRESIFVDFIDDKSGANKQQYTALHALEVEDIDVNRVLGEGAMGTNNAKRKPVAQNIAAVLRPELYERLFRMHGKTLSDVLVTRAPYVVDPLVALWERRLAKDGLPAELPSNITFTPALGKLYNRSADQLRSAVGDEPSEDEVIANMKSANQEQRQLLLHFGHQILLDRVELETGDDLHGQIDYTDEDTIEPDAELELFDYDEDTDEAVSMLDAELEPQESVEDTVIDLAIKGMLSKALGTLTERQELVLRARFGREATLDEIAQEIKRSRELIRQIESKALSKLRLPSVAQPLRDYLVEPVGSYEPPKKAYQKVTRGDSVFTEIPKVPVYDLIDGRPYMARLQAAYNDWLKEKTDKIGWIGIGSLQYKREETAILAFRVVEEIARVEKRPVNANNQEQRSATLEALVRWRDTLYSYSHSLQQSYDRRVGKVRSDSDNSNGSA